MKNFKELIQSLGIKPQDFAREVGITYGSYKTMTTKGRLKEKTPSWIKAFIFGLKMGRNEKTN